MSNLPGNPYEADANMYAIESSLRASWDEQERMILATQAVAHAQMSAAYEQRTANLIAVAKWTNGLDVASNLMDQVAERMGLEEWE